MYLCGLSSSFCDVRWLGKALLLTVYFNNNRVWQGRGELLPKGCMSHAPVWAGFPVGPATRSHRQREKTQVLTHSLCLKLCPRLWFLKYYLWFNLFLTRTFFATLIYVFEHAFLGTILGMWRPEDRQPAGSSYFLPCGVLSLNSGSQAWWQVPWPAEPCHHPHLEFWDGISLWDLELDWWTAGILLSLPTFLWSQE